MCAVALLSWPASAVDPRVHPPAPVDLAAMNTPGGQVPTYARARDEDMLHAFGKGSAEELQSRWGGPAARALDVGPRGSPTGNVGEGVAKFALHASTGGGAAAAPETAPISRLNGGAKNNLATVGGHQTHFDVDVVKHPRGQPEDRHIRGEVHDEKSIPTTEVDSPAPTVFVVIAISAVVCAIVSLFAA